MCIMLENPFSFFIEKALNRFSHIVPLYKICKQTVLGGHDEALSAGAKKETENIGNEIVLRAGNYN